MAVSQTLEKYFIRKLQSLTKIQKEWLRKRLRKADFGEKMRLHYYLGVILEDENEVQECFRIIQSEVLEATIKSLAYGMEQMVKPGDVITMSAGCRHTVIADTELKLIEVQLGADINVHDKQKFELEQ